MWLSTLCFLWYSHWNALFRDLHCVVDDFFTYFCDCDNLSTCGSALGDRIYACNSESHRLCAHLFSACRVCFSCQGRFESLSRLVLFVKNRNNSTPVIFLVLHAVLSSDYEILSAPTRRHWLHLGVLYFTTNFLGSDIIDTASQSPGLRCHANATSQFHSHPFQTDDHYTCWCVVAEDAPYIFKSLYQLQDIGCLDDWSHKTRLSSTLNGRDKKDACIIWDTIFDSHAF